MIFAGDIASPGDFTTECLGKGLNKASGLFKDRHIVCNLEGLIYDGPAIISNKPVLFNHSSILHILNTGKKPVFCLANNHVLDLPGQFEHTQNIFNSEGVSYCGAGKSIAEAEVPAVFFEGSSKIVLFNACWDFLLYNQKNPFSGVHVSKLKEEKLVERIRLYKRASQNDYIIVYLHWSLDLEILPFPMYRILSRDLIDAGASVVAGSHSHCIQGGEKYKDGFIVYGLGNFFMPHNQFIKGRLVYPEIASDELALEWDPSKNEATCHWLRYDNSTGEHELLHLGSERFEDSETLKKYSQYHVMRASDYNEYFRKNRRKKFLIPVYKDYHANTLNFIYTQFLKMRARVAYLLARMNVIKWQS
jgi:hypothetical protein